MSLHAILPLIEQTVDINCQSLMGSAHGSVAKFIFTNKLHISFWRAVGHSCQCCVSFAEGCMMGGLDSNKFSRLDHVHLERKKKQIFIHRGEIPIAPVPDQI